MRSSNLLALGAGVVLLVVVIWIVLPDRDDPSVPVGVSATAVERSAAVRERLKDIGVERSGGADEPGAVPARIVPADIGGRADQPGGAGLRRDGGESAPGAVRKRPSAVGTSGEAAEQSDVLADPLPEDMPAIKEMSLHDADPQRRLAAVTLLGAFDDPGVVPILSQALLDDDENVRLAAVQALADFTEELPVEAIEGALNDPSPDVRYEALEVLSEVGGEVSRRAAVKAMKDPDDDVRELAETMQGEDER
ncbi:HEAT repeat domain-containing protein [Candidatus Binatia bacterium]|nr:HEAT repeat domain-containing protein [Candidatus Binatia bacterium]